MAEQRSISSLVLARAARVLKFGVDRIALFERHSYDPVAIRKSLNRPLERAMAKLCANQPPETLVVWTRQGDAFSTARGVVESLSTLVSCHSNPEIIAQAFSDEFMDFPGFLGLVPGNDPITICAMPNYCCSNGEAVAIPSQPDYVRVLEDCSRAFEATLPGGSNRYAKTISDMRELLRK